MDLQKELKELEEKFQKSMNILIEDLSKIQAGRVSPAMLKPLSIIDSDGNKQNAMEIGLVRVINSRTLGIKPWIKANVSNVEKAIRASNLGVNPVTVEDEVTLPFPELTQERRNELAKSINTFGTTTKNSFRSLRHDFLKANKPATKEEEVKLDKDVQKIIDKFNNTVDEHIAKKQKELMQI